MKRIKRTILLLKGMYPVYQTENPTEKIRKINSGETDLAKLPEPGVELVGMMPEKGYPTAHRNPYAYGVGGLRKGRKRRRKWT